MTPTPKKRAVANRGAKKSAPKAKKPAPAKKPTANEIAAKAIAKAVVSAVTGDKPAPSPAPPHVHVVTPKPPTIYFEAGCGKYWVQYPGEPFTAYDSGNVDMHLRNAGFNGGKSYSGLSDCERVRFAAQRERQVCYAGPIAGYDVGLHRLASGQQVLVTESRRKWEGHPKSDPAFVLNFTKALLGDEQAMLMHVWRKLAIQSLDNGDFRPRQAMIVAGPGGCGKSFDQIVTTYAFGCRVASPAKFFWEGEQFTITLAGSEHWGMTETGKADMRRRRAYGELLKQYCVEPVMEVRAMHRAAIFMPTWRAITHTLNSEHEYVMTLPVIDDSTAGKIMLLLAKDAKATLSDDFKVNIQRLEDAMPGYIRWLRKLEVPPELKAPRMGVAHYHHPELLDIISDVSHSTHLREQIDNLLFAVELIDERMKSQECEFGTMRNEDKASGMWVGSATQLERALKAAAGPEMQWTVDRLLDRSPNACGNLLASLKSQNPERFRVKKVNGVSIWTIDLPASMKPKVKA